MESLLYIGAILVGLVIHNASGQPSITSTIQSLSGELCPDTVTFSCDWLNTDSSIIDIFVNDTRLVRYEFSVELTPVPTGFMAQIPSAEFNMVNRKYSYENFTLSADLDNLMAYQGQNISCGTLAVRSDFIYVGNYTTRDVPSFSTELFVSYSAVYTGLELKLSEIIVAWNDLNFSSDNCYQSIHYTARLTNNNNMVQNGDCSNMTCSATFLLETEGKQSDIYFITVTAFNGTQNISAGPISFDTSVSNGFTIRNDTDCKQRIVCSSNSNDNCSVRYRESESSSFKSFEVYQEMALNFTSGNLVYLEITKKIGPNQTFIAQINYTADNPRLNYNGYVGVGVTLMILGFIIQIVGSVVLVHWVMKSIKKSSIDQRVFLWVVLQGMSWILAIVSLSLWISYGVVNDSGSCTSGPEEAIAIVATAMSILLVVVSAVITGALLLVDFKCEKKKTQEGEEPEKVSYDKRYKLRFGKEYNTKESGCQYTHNCKCGAALGDVTNIKSAVIEGATQLKDDLKSVKSAIVETFKPRKDMLSTKPEVTEGKKRKCRACPNNMCKDCERYAFRKQTLEWEQVCEDCCLGYDREKEAILELPKVGLFQPVQQENDDICYECESAEEKQKLKYCPGCGHWVCDNCIVTKEQVYLQYSKQHELVCKNCYALIKIMDGNSYSKDEDVKEVNNDVAQETQTELMQGSLNVAPKEDIEEVTDKLPCELQVKVVPGNFESEYTEERKKDKELGKEKLTKQMKVLQRNHISDSREDEMEGRSDEVLNTKL